MALRVQPGKLPVGLRSAEVNGHQVWILASHDLANLSCDLDLDAETLGKRIAAVAAELDAGALQPPKPRGVRRWLKNRIADAAGVQIPDQLRAAIPDIETQWRVRVRNAAECGHRLGGGAQNSQLKTLTGWLQHGPDVVRERIREASDGGWAGIGKEPRARKPQRPVEQVHYRRIGEDTLLPGEERT